MERIADGHTGDGARGRRLRRSAEELTPRQHKQLDMVAIEAASRILVRGPSASSRPRSSALPSVRSSSGYGQVFGTQSDAQHLRRQRVAALRQAPQGAWCGPGRGSPHGADADEVRVRDALCGALDRRAASRGRRATQDSRQTGDAAPIGMGCVQNAGGSDCRRSTGVSHVIGLRPMVSCRQSQVEDPCWMAGQVVLSIQPEVPCHT